MAWWAPIAAAGIGAAASYLGSRQAGPKLHGFQERALKRYQQMAQDVASRPYEAYGGTPYAPINPSLRQMYGYTPFLAEAGWRQFGRADQDRGDARGLADEIPGSEYQTQAGAGFQQGAGFQAPMLSSGGIMGDAGIYRNPGVQAGPAWAAMQRVLDSGALDAGTAILREAGTFRPGPLVEEDVSRLTSSYMNPYTQNVVDLTREDLDRARQIAQVNRSEQFGRMNALGGSGQQRADALTNETFAREMARTSAGLRQQGYESARGAALRTLEGNQARALQAAGLRAGAGQNLAQLGANISGRMAQMGMQDFAQARDLAMRMGLANQGATMQAEQMRQQAYRQLMGLGGEMNREQMNRARFLANLAQNTEATGSNRLQQAYRLGREQQQYDERAPAWQYQQWMAEQEYPIRMMQLYGQAATETAQPYESNSRRNPWLMAGLAALGGGAAYAPQAYRAYQTEQRQQATQPNYWLASNWQV